MANPYGSRLKRDPVGLGLLLGLPVLLVALMLAGKGQAHTVAALVTGWVVVGAWPVALAGQRASEVEARWRSLPVGAADRFFQAFAGLAPASLAAGLALTAVAYGLGPAALRVPALLVVGLVTTLVMTLVGLAVAAWTRTLWQAAAVMAFFVLAALWGAVAGGGAWGELLPSGQAASALGAIARPGDLAAPLVKLGIMGLVAAALAVAGFGRR